MTKNTIIITNNNVAPVDQICIVAIDTDATPPTDTTTELDYNNLTAAEKTQFDNCVTMLKSKT